MVLKFTPRVYPEFKPEPNVLKPANPLSFYPKYVEPIAELTRGLRYILTGEPKELVAEAETVARELIAAGRLVEKASALPIDPISRRMVFSALHELYQTAWAYRAHYREATQGESGLPQEIRRQDMMDGFAEAFSSPSFRRARLLASARPSTDHWILLDKAITQLEARGLNLSDIPADHSVLPPGPIDVAAFSRALEAYILPGKPFPNPKLVYDKFELHRKALLESESDEEILHVLKYLDTFLKSLESLERALKELEGLTPIQRIVQAEKELAYRILRNELMDRLEHLRDNQPQGQLRKELSLYLLELSRLPETSE